ncbi:uncharacterized protein CANTADRAFT_7047 [Suhomyces tanzawaensis NRRL Y-17324]|uniref:Serine hydrolase domain-containing protein n=1 Tax=Suhomyces tanzawaensis NRRL Y-17324 TaxID=984487 RepID=A0A1E4SGQ4_9ASCO|nr:uncharacterized protein CANTADRAFT_7047 [Suhomyces tanzawaensis NRRL Y-17324]ODV78697.1 hypothetical protein CANTADRAFT_7047 [Suhomyces tanzawaensis NRRL Y-17324]
MAPKTQQFKAKILFLHGFTQTASTFYSKTSALRKRLHKLEYKTVYLNGPYLVEPTSIGSDLALFDSAGLTNRGWWLKPKADEGFGLETSIETLRNYIEKGEMISDEDNSVVTIELEEDRSLPIVGLVGFSQGAAFAGVLAHNFDKIFNIAPLKFLVLYGGFKIDMKIKGNDRFQSYFPDPEVPDKHFKYLHVYGELDTVVGEDRALTLYDITKGNSDLLKHPGGHFVPNSRLLVDQVTNWIQVATAETHEQKEKKEESLDDLMDMMDNLGKA